VASRELTGAPVTVRIRLYAILRERARRDWVELELPAGATVADALEELSHAQGLGEVLARLPVRMAVNREYAESHTPLHEGDELAVIPPVSGGGGRAQVQLTPKPLSLEALARAVGRPQAGAVVVFEGVTRDVERLEYEAYETMAEQRIQVIMDECMARHRLEAAAAVHRTGTVPRGEPSVIVAVSAAHRAEAFAGAREAIDRIKAEAPIWKQEISAGEARWVQP
jgi:MoaE-MoaD fusion protein